jgi:spore coat protein CotF
MPELTPSELLQIHEVALAHAIAIEKAAVYTAMAKDPDLAAMLRHSRQKKEAHYQELVDISQGAPLDRRFEQMDGGLAGRPRQAGGASTQPLQPEPQRAAFSDRTIAGDCLNDAKTMAVRAIWAATEISHVGLRRALSEMARYHLDEAYEFYRYMEQQGWYVPLRPGENAQQWFRETHRPLAGEPERQPLYS